jgi:hypothetical protein
MNMHCDYEVRDTLTSEYKPYDFRRLPHVLPEAIKETCTREDLSEKRFEFWVGPARERVSFIWRAAQADKRTLKHEGKGDIKFIADNETGCDRWAFYDAKPVDREIGVSEIDSVGTGTPDFMAVYINGVPVKSGPHDKMDISGNTARLGNGGSTTESTTVPAFAPVIVHAVATYQGGQCSQIFVKGVVPGSAWP